MYRRALAVYITLFLMSCVLRVTTTMLSEQLAKISLKPYRMDKGCAHFSVSKCDFDDFPGQLRDALVFLSVNEVDVTLLMRSAEATGVLDFAVEVRTEGFQFRAFPPALVSLAGGMGLGLELSLYPAESS